MPITRRDYFKPIQLGGCVLWLDGTDPAGTGTAPANGSTLTSWVDKSGAGRNLIVGSGTTTYTNSAITLANSYMYVASAVDLTNFSFFIIAKTNAAINNQTVFGARPNTSSLLTSSDGFGFYMDNQTAIRFFGNNTAGQFINQSIATSNPNIFSFTSGSTVINGLFNGTPVTGATGLATRTSTAQGFAIGAEWSGSAYGNTVSTASIYEIIVYNQGLSTTQGQQVEAYLAQKWSLTGSLPAGHPGLTSVLYRPVTNTLTKTVYYTQFSPKSIPGASLWLDGADPAGTGVVPANGATVSTWIDKSGSGYNATGGVSPTYNTSQRAIVFNGSSWLTTSYSSVPANETAFIVYQTTSAAVANNCFMIGPTNIGGRLILSVNENDGFGLSFKIGSYGVANGSRIAQIQNQIYLGTTTVASTTSFVYLNGTQGPSSTLTYSGAGTTQIGTAVSGTAIYIGFIYEIVIFNRLLSNPERQTIESYLAQKWRLTTALPASHINNTFPAGSPLALQTYITNIQTNVGYIPFLPGTPSINAPTNTGNITTLTMTWSASLVTSGYIVYILASGSPVAGTGIGTGGTQTIGNVLIATFSPMTTNVPYSYYVVATGPTGTGVASPISASTTYYATPGIPTLNTPTNTGLVLNMSWNAPTGTTTYYTVYVLVNGSAATTLSPISGLSTTYTPMISAAAYSFYVTATNTIAAATSGNSSTSTPDIIYYAAPGTPSINTPTNTGNLTTLTMTWNAASGTVSGYIVYILEGGNLVAGTGIGTGGTQTLGNVLTASFAPMTTNLGYSYYVAATGPGGTGVVSSTSTPTVFYYATPGAPTVGTATNTGNLSTLTMTWTAGSGTTTYYTVYVVVGGSTVATLSPGNVLTTTYSMTTNLSYTFYVTATNTIAGATSGSSATSSSAIYYAPPGQATVSTPTNTGNSTTLTMNWSAASGTVTNYTVYVLANNIQVAGTGIGTGGTQTLGNVLTASFSPMTTNVPYTFYVIALNNGIAGTQSTTSSSAIYYVPPVGGSITLNAGLTPTSGTVTITAATDATSYTVYISTTTSFTGSVHSFTTSTTGSAVAFTPSPNLIGGTTYYAVLLPVNVSVNGTYSNSTGLLLTVIPSAPASLTVSMAGSLASFTIASTTYATSYTVTLFSNAANSNSGGTQVVNAGNPFSTASLTPTLAGSFSAAYYYATVTASNSSGTSSATTSAAVAVTLLYSYTGSLTFTPAGSTGRLGPTLSQCTTAYSSFGAWVTNTAYFNMTTQGYQRWTVPQTKNYFFAVAGANSYKGASGNLADGNLFTFSTTLTINHIIVIVVGQSGQSGTSACGHTIGSGGGGSFVFNETTSTLIAASGGAGGGSSTGTFGRNYYANSVTTGSAGEGNYQGGPFAGGSGGGGGTGELGGLCGPPGGGGGGGYTGNGTGYLIAGNPQIVAGFSYTNGATGGSPPTSGREGGFGGGGASGFYCGGGGGGYSGGGSGAFLSACSCGTGAGGGGGAGSYSITTGSTNTNSGTGYVTIT